MYTRSLSHVQLFSTPWTVVHQAPLSMGFSRQEYWSGLPLPSPRESLEQSILWMCLNILRGTKVLSRIKSCRKEKQSWYIMQVSIYTIIIAGSQHGSPHPRQGHVGKFWWARQARTQGVPLWACLSIYPKTRVCLFYYFTTFTNSSDINGGLSLTTFLCKKINLKL